MTQYITVDESHAGQRLDNFLLGLLKVPKSLVYRIIRKGEVRINGGRIKPEVRLCLDDKVRIPPLHSIGKKPIAKIDNKILSTLKESILFETTDLLVLNKPAGFAVHGGSNVPFGVIEALRELLNYPFLELVHRLDRATSGCLLLAKNRKTLTALHQLITAGQIEKYYAAVVSGQWPVALMRCDQPLKKVSVTEGQAKVLATREGKKACTLFEVQEANNDKSFLIAQLVTGRTHQIRVHCAYLGYPIIGDPLYGDFKINNTMKKAGLDRMLLHAMRVRFTLKGQIIDIKAPLPKEFKDITSL